MIKHLKRFFQFVKDVANDPRIPAHDKTVVLGLLALLISPVDIIPDWIPIFGWMDDIVIAALLLDYFFEVLDPQIILSHYPYGTKSFERIRSIAKLVTVVTPQPIKEKLWTYQVPVGGENQTTVKTDEPKKTVIDVQADQSDSAEKRKH